MVLELNRPSKMCGLGGQAHDFPHLGFLIRKVGTTLASEFWNFPRLVQRTWQAGVFPSSYTLGLDTLP